MQVWDVLRAARWKYSTQKWRKNRHLGSAHPTNLSAYIFATRACIDNRKKTTMSPQICSHNVVNFRPLMAEIGSGVWGTPANFNRFRVIASLVHRRRSTEAKPNFARCLAEWAATQYIHFWRLLRPNGILPGAKFTLCPSLAFSYIGSITARHSSSVRQPNFAACDKEWN